MSRTRGLLTLLVCGLLLASMNAGGQEKIRIALDWTPNTNHTGILVARARGYFADEGLDVDVLETGPGMGVYLAVSGQCEFAVSMQEEITMARSQGMPIVSLAAIYPHNTSGFAVPERLGVESPQGFEGLRYGGWGQDFEWAIIRTVMQAVNADVDKVRLVDLGMVDFVTAIQRELADFYWIFYGWQGIQALLLEIDVVYLPLVDLAEELDYYTPVIAASETMIAEQPETIRRFLRALARGYVFAAQHPEDAAEALLAFAPELDRDLVVTSQAWLAGQSVHVIQQWGWQREETWRTFSDWAYEHGVIDDPIIAQDAYTNEFLPGEAPS